mgnify:FL=1
MTSFHERPWGTYEVLLDEPNYKVKRIVVNPNQKFSLQYHERRSEFWTIVSGYGTVIIDEAATPATPGTFWYIPRNAIHRASAGEDELVFIETQIGECDEDDIIRIQDDYGRVT